MAETSFLLENAQIIRNQNFDKAANELMTEINQMLGINSPDTNNDKMKEHLIQTLKSLTGDA